MSFYSLSLTILFKHITDRTQKERHKREAFGHAVFETISCNNLMLAPLAAQAYQPERTNFNNTKSNIYRTMV